MAKLNNDWYHAFRGCFNNEEDIIEFIFRHLDTSDFEDSYIDAGGHNEPNEMFKQTAEDKIRLLYEFIMELVEKNNQKEEKQMGRYKLIIQDATNAYVLDKEEETIVCLCNTKRPDLEFGKLKELIDKANENSVNK